MTSNNSDDHGYATPRIFTLYIKDYQINYGISD